MSKQLPGKILDQADRDGHLLAHFKATVTMAGHCRMSGSPERGVLLLAGVLPVQLRMVYYGWTGKAESLAPVTMLEQLAGDGYLDPGQADVLVDAMAAAAIGSGRDVRQVMTAAMILNEVLGSDAFVACRKRWVLERRAKQAAKVEANAAAAVAPAGPGVVVEPAVRPARRWMQTAAAVLTLDAMR